MLHLVPIALLGGAVSLGLTLVNKRKPATPLIATLDVPTMLSHDGASSGRLQEIKTALTARLTALDDQYQHFVQRRVDPLLGKARHAHLQEMLHEQSVELTPDERFANRRIGIGALALSTALLGQFVYPPLTVVAILLGFSTVFTIYEFAYQEWQQKRRLTSVHLLCIYIAFLWLGGYASIGALGSFLVGIGFKVKALTENRSRHHLIQLFQLQPDKVWVRNRDGLEVEIPFAQLQVGDTLVLQAGQLVPVDGRIIAGAATVDQHRLTGEAQPVEKTLGDELLATTLLITGKVDLAVEKTGMATTAGQIVAMLNQAAEQNTQMGLKVLEMTDRFVAPTLALSAVSWPLLGPASAVSLMGANLTVNTYISGPLAALNFLNLAAATGILIKDSSALEQLSTVNTVIFDKTGTLTLEQPQVVQIYALQDVSATEILRLAAAAEARQTHPIAAALLAAAAAQKLVLPSIDQAHYELGLGLKVWLTETIEGREPAPAGNMLAIQDVDAAQRGADQTAPALVHVGSSRFMAQEGIDVPVAVEQLQTTCQANGHSLVMVALNEVLVGCIELQPTVRPEAKALIEGLQARGLALYIISGDQEAPTRKLAHDLGMTGYFANVLPEGKAQLVEQLQQQGAQVCFIGDGINDAIALRKAHVAISLRGATTAATDTAQIILMEGNLNGLLPLFELAGRFTGNLKQNFRFTAGVSMAAMAGILLVGFTFAATEILYTVSLLGSLGIAMLPLVARRAEVKRLGE